MNRKWYLLALRLFILLTPLVFARPGGRFSPLFYLFLCLLAWAGFRREQRPLNYPFRLWVRLGFAGLLAVMVLQLLPLPVALLRLVSRGTVFALGQLSSPVPSFHSTSVVPVDTLGSILQLIAAGLFFASIVASKWEKDELFSVIHTLVLSALLLWVAGLTGILPRSMGPKSRYFVFYAVTVIPLSLGMFLVKLRYLESSRSLFDKVFTGLLETPRAFSVGVMGGLLCIGVLYSRNRAALVVMALTCALTLMWTYYFHRPHALRRRLKWPLIVVAVLAAFMGLQYAVKHLSKAHYDGHVPDAVRWRQTLSTIKAFPLAGAGFGTWDEVNFLYDPVYQVHWHPQANNGYLVRLAEGGLAGGMLLFLLLTLPAVAAIKTWWKRRHPQIKMMGLGISVSVLAALMHNLFSNSLLLPPNLLVYVLLLAAGLKLAAYKKRM